MIAEIDFPLQFARGNNSANKCKTILSQRTVYLFEILAPVVSVQCFGEKICHVSSHSTSFYASIDTVKYIFKYTQ